MQASSHNARPFSLGRLVAAGLRHHWRTHLAVALAVMAANAVLTGALVVGDSMRGSLRHLLLDQLGRIDGILVTDRFFRAELAGELQANPRFQEHFAAAVSAIYVQGTIENPENNRRAGGASVIGADAAFFKLGTGGPQEVPQRNQIVLNASLAAEIGARVGDDVLLRIGSASQIPADSALGRKTETIRNRRLQVSAIIPAEGLGRFSLNPSQQIPRVAYVSPAALQDALEQPGKVNALFVAGRDDRPPGQAADDALAEMLQPTLADFGLEIKASKLGYVQLTSNRMLLEPTVVEAAGKAFAADRPQEVFTYLANTIALGDKQIPYSTITAIDFVDSPPLGPFLSAGGEPVGPLADDEIALSSWAADNLGAKPGDEIEIVYFEPESTHGKVRESTARFRLKAIVDLKGLADDPDLTPQLPGVTDQLSIGDWDPPFPFDSKRVRDEDERYWDEHRTTPKAYVSLATGRRLWSSRFGDTTSVRFAPPPGPTLQAQEKQLAIEPESLGFVFRPIKRMGLAAAQGTTSFGGLFFGFSLFIMVASLLLVALLFRLGIEQRAEQIGVLRTVGFPGRKIFAVLASEALIVTSLGAVLGVVAGVGYAWLMLEGLRTWWVAAISTPFLRLYVTPGSLIAGFVAGLFVSLATVLWTLRRLRAVTVRRLLSGSAEQDRFGTRSTGRRTMWIAATLLIVAVASAAAAPGLSGEAQAGAFVGSGAMVLAAALVWIFGRMRRGRTAQIVGNAPLPMTRLAARNGARNPGRSTLSIGLIAAASFLIVALSAFRLDPAGLGEGPDSGSGGFSLVAQSDKPIYQDLNTPEGRAELGLSPEADQRAAKSQTVALRVRAGDDASCLNLYQAAEPRVLGVPRAMIERGGFAWAGSSSSSPEQRENPWLLLDEKLPAMLDAPVVPAVVDFNTAQYSLHKGLGDDVVIDDGYGRTLRLRIVGLLKNSILQGDLLVSEAAFLEHFPEVNGYRFFLIDTGEQPIDKVQQELESALGDFGFDAETSRQRLASFFAVQNTYLSTFQSLGGLGLLLGTFGLATVQLRSVLERRGELALMRAAGFRRTRLARLVMIENALLLLAGLGVGIAAALVAVLPHWLGGGAEVPWLSLALTLALVLIAGLAAGLIAVRATLRAPLLPALRAD